MPKRKRIEQGFGWAKFMAPIRRVMVRDTKKVDQLFHDGHGGLQARAYA